jgi:hypothetical protein
VDNHGGDRLMYKGTSLKRNTHPVGAYSSPMPRDVTPSHSVELEGFNASRIRGLRDQICTTQGHKVDCVRQVDV